MAQSSTALRIGTRGSPLALVQAREVAARLLAAHGVAAELKIIKTSGDALQDRSLADEGGKGLFTKEIEEALLAGHIDLAVHSAKDVPTLLPNGLMLAACLEREDARDVFIGASVKTLRDLRKGAVVGTSSPRRQALVKRARPDVEIAVMRGNVETRLRKLADGAADATILALAGLKRLGLAAHASTIMSVEEFLPAAGQGAIAIEVREDNEKIRALLNAIDHADTSTALAAERAFLGVLDGSCRTPIAGHATIAGGKLKFRGLIAKPDGSAAFDASREGNVRDAIALGTDAGRELKKRAGPDFFR